MKKIPPLFDTKWIEIYASVWDQCFIDAKANAAKLQAAAQVTKEQCDLTFILVALCVDLIAFSVSCFFFKTWLVAMFVFFSKLFIFKKCPTENWKATSECAASRKFIETCGANAETLMTLGIWTHFQFPRNHKKKLLQRQLH